MRVLLFLISLFVAASSSATDNTQICRFGVCLSYSSDWRLVKTAEDDDFKAISFQSMDSTEAGRIVSYVQIYEFIIDEKPIDIVKTISDGFSSDLGVPVLSRSVSDVDLKNINNVSWSCYEEKVIFDMVAMGVPQMRNYCVSSVNGNTYILMSSFTESSYKTKKNINDLLWSTIKIGMP